MNLPVLMRRPYHVNIILKEFKFKPNYAELCAVPNIYLEMEPSNPEWTATIEKTVEFFQGIGRSYYTNTLAFVGISH